MQLHLSILFCMASGVLVTIRKSVSLFLGSSTNPPFDHAVISWSVHLRIPVISYTNFLITNKKVLMQQYYREGTSSEKVRQGDEKALEILRSCFPDRDVTPIDAFALNVLGGGIHCLPRNVPLPVISDKK